MRLLFIADGRSPTALQWLKYWPEKGHEVHLISTYPCTTPSGLASFHVLPVAFGRMAGSQAGSHAHSVRRWGGVRGLRNRLLSLRYWLGPLGLPVYRSQFLRLLKEIRPDLVHALRIPFEGMLAAATPPGLPLAVSIWGNDLTLHARGSFLMARLTCETLRRTDGLLADTARDIRLAAEWGFSAEKPTLIIPGAGGIRTDQISAPALEQESGVFPQELPHAPIVVNARGQRPGSLRQDVFFQAIPLVLEKVPQAFFICPSLGGDAESERWVETLGIRPHTFLWPRLAQQTQLWKLLQAAQVFVSPCLHDGTPNSLLEAMACGCFPVVGDIASMREWIQPGVNGLLADAASPRSLAEAVIKGLQDPQLRSTAKKENARIIAERADYRRCMAMVEAFYSKLIAV